MLHRDRLGAGFADREPLERALERTGRAGRVARREIEGGRRDDLPAADPPAAGPPPPPADGEPGEVAPPGGSAP